MKKAVIIGGKGKVGTYLVPMLAENDFEIVSVSRGKSKPYEDSSCWESVRQLSVDRSDPAFAEIIAAEQADVVVDMICFTPEQMKSLTDKLAGNTGHYLVCCSAWIHGRCEMLNVLEHESVKPICEYGKRKKAMTELMKRLWAYEHFPATAVHPTHISGVGHLPINPQGNRSLEVWSALKNGKELVLPNSGFETLQHVHAKDVAGVFMAAINAGSISFGQDFHASSERAYTMEYFAKQAASWFGKEAKLSYKPLNELLESLPKADAYETLDHASHSASVSVEKAKKLLGFTPKYTGIEAAKESVMWLNEKGMI